MTTAVTDKLQTDLRFQLKALSESYWQLSAKLTRAAKELCDPGVPPSAELLDKLATAQKEFIVLRARLLEQTRAIESAPAPDPDNLVSLKDLVTVLQEALEARKKSMADEARQQVMRLLDQVLQLVHREKPDFAPLAECQAKARDLKSALAGADWENPPSDQIQALVPFSDLLTIVEQLEQLDDETLERLQDVTTPAFGKLLTVAASRGRLILSEAAKEAAPAAEPSMFSPDPSAAAVQPARPDPADVAPAPTLEGAPAPMAEAGSAPTQEGAPAPMAEGAPAPMAEGAPAPTAEGVPTSPEGAGEIPPPESHELVQLVTELYSLLGHKVEKALLRSDRDVDLTIRSSNGKTWIARCRSLEETVDESEVRNFYGVMQQERAAQGAIITLGTFTPQARQWAKSNLLYLLDKKEFFDYLNRARTRKSDSGAEML